MRSIEDKKKQLREEGYAVYKIGNRWWAHKEPTGSPFVISSDWSYLGVILFIVGYLIFMRLVVISCRK